MKANLTVVLLGISAFLTPIKGLLCLITLAVTIDTAYALYRVIKLEGFNGIKSTKLFNLVVKTLFYQTTIILSYLIDVYIFDCVILGVPHLTSRVVCGVWLVIELKSIEETRITLGKKPFFEILKGVISKAKEFKKDLNELKK